MVGIKTSPQVARLHCGTAGLSTTCRWWRGSYRNFPRKIWILSIRGKRWERGMTSSSYSHSPIPIHSLNADGTMIRYINIYNHGIRFNELLESFPIPKPIRTSISTSHPVGTRGRCHDLHRLVGESFWISGARWLVDGLGRRRRGPRR